MRLKRLEAYGFKSFADKLVLDFNEGVTCIVGPNGCGKSNISDAIRWVLGEQSPKKLRGKNMQEVIFSGTESRKALGYCEVTLIFDNEDRTYDVDADEVIIKRKLFRSGDSEYYINNKQVRLLDVTDLFRDTGIGKDGYSVVGQGKIDSLLSAKPEERRQVFEEAAGISKYKAKRQISQNKLLKTNDNLLRIKDKLEVYETRMAPLIKQSEEALKARELKSRLKNCEVNHYIYLTEHHAEEKKTVANRLASLDRSLADSEKERDILADEYAELQEKVRTTDEEYRRLTDEKLEISIRLSQKTGQNNLKLQQLETVREGINRLKGELKEKNSAINDHTAALDAYKKEQQEVIAKIVSTKKDEEAAEERLKKADEEVDRQREQIDVTNSMLLSSADAWGQINGGLSQLKTEIVLLEKSREENKNLLEEKTAELKEATKLLTDLEEEIAYKTADREEKKGFRKDIDGQYAKKLADCDEAQDQYNEIRGTVAKLTSKIEYLEAGKNSYSSYDAAVRFLMNAEPAVKSKVLGVVGSVISTPSQFATAIEVALGGNINNMITADQRDTSYLIDYLNANRGGRGTFLPLEAMRPRPLEDAYMDALDEEGCYGLAADLVKYERRFRPAIETLLGRVVVVDTKDTAVRMVRTYRNAFRIVTLDGAHYAVNGAVSGGRKEGADTRLLRVEADLNDTKKSLDNQNRMLSALSEELTELRAKLKEMETASRVLDGIIAKLDKDIGVCEQKKASAESEVARLRKESDLLKETIASAGREIETKKAMFAAENAKIDSTSSERVDANELLEKLAIRLKEKEREREKISSERTEIILLAKQLESKLSEIEKSIVISTRTVERLTRETADADVQIRMAESEEKAVTAELEKLAAELSGNDELVAVQEKIDLMDKEKVTFAERTETLRRKEQKNSEILASLSAAKAKAEASLERIDSEIRAAGERVMEEYGLDYRGACELKDYDYDDEKGMQEAKVLRRELAKLGDINEKAVEDLATMNAEYADLKLHYDDITEAKASLEDTIKDLTAKMEKNFAESFEKIKVNFAEVFKELFGGGKGMLDLEMERNTSILEAGIIIAAEPPGKRLQNIDLLSGGERAMTAIALIFAIIKLHPMPFCVLDEVDAPLDDNNAATYAKYLRKFSKGTQFIIVSHRKPTMQLADALYGITMQEKGVSKFFSTQFKDAQKFATTV